MKKLISSLIILTTLSGMIIIGCKNNNKEIVNLKIPSESWWDSNETIMLSGEEIFKSFVETEDFILGPLLFLDNDTIIISNKNKVEAFYCKLTNNKKVEIVQFGNGSEELIDIESIFRTENGFSIFGLESKKIIFFNNNGDLISTENLNNHFRDVDIIDGKLVGLAMDGSCKTDDSSSNNCLFIYDKTTDDSNILFSKLDRYDQMVKIPENFGSIGSLGRIAVKENTIYVANAMQNYVYIIDKDGVNEKYIYMDDPFFKKMSLTFKNGEMTRGIGVNTDIDITNNGDILLGKSTWMDDKFRIDIIKTEGEIAKILQIDNYPKYISYYNSRLLVADDHHKNNIMIYDLPNL